MKTLAEIKKELKKYKTSTVTSILVEENDGDFTIDVCATVTDAYGNYNSEYITLDGFETEAKAIKHAKMLATKFNTEMEMANC
jgi:hypothetical protein